MKTHLFSLLALTSLTAFAGPMPSENVQTTKNADMSSTIKQPHFLRGNRSLYIASSNPGLNICKALGFNFFMDNNLTSGEVGSGYAMLTADGNYSTTSAYNAYRVEEITCYNELSQTTKVEEKIENPDETVTIMNPKLLRGNRVLAISTGSNSNGVCKALGFQKFLEGSQYSGDVGSGLAVMNAEGGFSNYNGYNSYSIKEITCSKGESTPVLVDANGRKYSRKN